MALLTKELAHSALKDQIAYLIGPAPLVSSLDMKGFSLSLLRLNETFEKAINADVQTVGWQKPVPFAPMKTQRHSPVYNQLEIEPSENPQVKTLVSTAARTLVDLENRLNALDAKVGDGDTGSTFAEGAREIIHLLEQGELPLNNTAQLLQLIGERLATVMGGSSGVLMSIFFTAAGQAVHDGKPLPEALLRGLHQMKHYGGAELGDRTLIDALQPALEALRDSGLDAAASAAKAGAARTATMQTAGAGRSSYVNSENLEGITDPGAVAIADVFAAIAKG
jgi:dihydroxyacetone kinase